MTKPKFKVGDVIASNNGRLTLVVIELDIFHYRLQGDGSPFHERVEVVDGNFVLRSESKKSKADLLILASRAPIRELSMMYFDRENGCVTVEEASKLAVDYAEAVLAEIERRKV